MALLRCSCGVDNRLPKAGATAQRVRCGKCKHVFTPLELAKARPEEPPKRGFDPSILGGTDFVDQGGGDDEPETLYACAACGWEGSEDDVAQDNADRNVCPDCGKRVKPLVNDNQEESDAE